jgi:fermentation-respiration switch protein FrsA (DUF1100 family)
MKRLLPLLALLALPATAEAAPPNPFGHPCTAQNGVLFCPTATDGDRVASFDGVPLDVDVTLPPTGDGPFPTIVMMHGWGGSKRDFQSTTPDGDGNVGYHYNNVYYAQQGYAVITYSARGFGRSCGAADSRTAPACDRGWVHLADQRYEARDTQYLLGLLVDQGVVKPDAIGVTGISYGGIQTMNLAGLSFRVRLPDGSFEMWTSPAGTLLSIKAAWSRWGGSDMSYALDPNGRFLDFKPFKDAQSRTPGGVMKKSYVDGLYALGNTTGYFAPQGADPTADLTTWKAVTDRGEPYGQDAVATAEELTHFHSVVGLSGPTPPLLLQNGWTDDLFPVEEAVRLYNIVRKTSTPQVSLQVGDLGHARGSNKSDTNRFFNDQGAGFFSHYLKGTGSAPAPGHVDAFRQTCPTSAPAGRRYGGGWDNLHQGVVRFRGLGAQTVTSGGGNTATLKAFDPLGADACKTVRREHARGTAVYEQFVKGPYTLLGFPTIDATIKARGRGGMLAGRLWDVAGGQQRLVSRGVYRLTDNQKGKVTFQLFGNGYRFEPGHVVKLELLGRDPGFLRPSNFKFKVKVSKVTVELPTREPASRKRGISRPRRGR